MAWRRDVQASCARKALRLQAAQTWEAALFSMQRYTKHAVEQQRHTPHALERLAGLLAHASLRARLSSLLLHSLELVLQS